jgi:hypothetical protein
MATAQEATPGSQDLSTFQTVVQQQEGIFGPLTALSNHGANNVMTFQVGPSPDASHRAILETYTDHPPAKAGYVLVCIGSCLVSSVLQQVAAYRKTPWTHRSFVQSTITRQAPIFRIGDSERSPAERDLLRAQRAKRAL